MKRWVPTFAALLLLGTAGTSVAAPLLEEGGAHIHWLQRDNAWFRGVGVVQANTDPTPDIVVAAGDRDASYQQCLAPPGYPGATINQHKDQVLIPASKLAVLDGRTGDPIWEVVWRPGGDAADPPSSEKWHLLSGVHTGDLDGDGAADLVVIRTEKPKDGTDQIQHITSYDPRTGATEWDIVETFPPNTPPIAQLTPMDVFGRPGALLSQLSMIITFEGGGIDVTFEGTNQLVELEAGKAPKKVVELPNDLIAAIPVRYGDGYRFISFPVRISGPPPSAAVDARAIDLVRLPNGELELTEAWSRPAAGGFPAHVTGGTDPAVVLGRLTSGDDGNVVAMDLDTGADRWTSSVNAGPGGGSILPADVNADGVIDVVASPKMGDEPTGLLNGGPAAELHALDGRTGQSLWTKTDPLAKFRAHSLELIDIDGTGGPEIVGLMAGQDGFAGCSTPNDDTGSINVWSLTTGAERCRLFTDRFATDVVGANLNAAAGQEIVAPTLGGNVYAFTNAEPGCGALGTNPLE